MRFSSSDCCLWLCFDRAWTDRICSLAATAGDDDGADICRAEVPPPPPFRTELGATRSLRELRGKLLPDIDNDAIVVLVACSPRAPQKLSHAMMNYWRTSPKIPEPELFQAPLSGLSLSFNQSIMKCVCVPREGLVACGQYTNACTHDVPLTLSAPCG